MRTACVISYCSYQKAFIRPLIKEFKKFVTGEIVVVSFDKFFDGKKDEPLKSFGEIDLRLKFEPGHESRYYHNLQRKAGFDVLQGEYDAVYFADCDEIPIGELMKAWQENQCELNTDYRFASNWYYRDVCYQATEAIDSLALVSMKSLLNDCIWYNDNEREGFAEYKSWRRLTRNWEGKVMVDHYGWAGTKEMLLRKVQSWGHNEDRDWVAMVNEEFKQGFGFRCPFEPYRVFRKVEPKLPLFNK